MNLSGRIYPSGMFLSGVHNFYERNRKLCLASGLLSDEEMNVKQWIFKVKE